VAAAALVHAPGGGIRLAALPPLALYVHVPWCLRKCPYCDFNSHELGGLHPAQPTASGRGTIGIPEDLEGRYVEALVRDLEYSLPDIWGRKVHGVFFGGGTPSLLAARSVDVLLSAFRARVPLASDCEITLEANPGTFETGKFRDFRAAGINRLSIGIQSFDAGHLASIGRIHDDREARRAVEIAMAHFENVNLDLMYALPGQSLVQSQADCTEAVASGAPHLSFYQLTIEPNTLFHRYAPELPDDDLAAEMQSSIESALSAAGYGHYETSAYAKPGRECRHNLNYWRFGDYLGIGAGAHSKLSFHDRVSRSARCKQPKEYLQRVSEGAPLQESRVVGREDLAFEFMLNALRLAAGFPVALFAERTGLPITAAEKPLAQAEARGLIERDHERIRPTDLGRRFLNDLLQLFLPEADSR